MFSLFVLLTQGVCAGLPADYTRLEYVESTGAQYIDTGVQAKSGISAEGDFAWLASSNDTALLGAIGNSTQYLLFHVYGWNWCACYKSWTNLKIASSNGLRYCAKADFAAGAQRLTVNGKQLYSGTNGETIDAGVNLFVFAYNNGGTATGKSKVRLWGMKIYDGVQLVRHYVPVKNGEGVAGLYDLVNDEFKPPVGNAFTAGAAVSEYWPADKVLDADLDLRGQGTIAVDGTVNLNGYKLFVDGLTGMGEITDAADYVRLEYVQSNGSQWVDTGVVGKSGVSCEADLIVYDTAAKSGDRHLLASQGNGQQYDLIGAYNNNWYLGYPAINGSSGYKKGGLISNATRYTVSSKLYSGEQWYKVNDTVDMSGTSSTACNTARNIYVFAFNWDGTAKYGGSARLFALSLAVNGTPTRDFVPAKRCSDGAIGLYDLIGQSFHPNGSSTPLVAGVELGAIVPEGETVGELHVDVAAGSVASLGQALKLSGKLAVIKDGAGRVTASGREQSYSGGTVVSNGVFVCAAEGNTLGTFSSSVTVADGAVFDFDGNCGYSAYEFVLDGGTISNTTYRSNWTGSYFSKVTVRADSFLAGSLYGLQNGIANDSPACEVEMNGHTLTIDSVIGNDYFYFSKTVFTGGGKLVARSGRVYFGVGGAARECDFGTTRLEVQNAAVCLGSAHTIIEYATSYSGNESFSATLPLKVTGRFVPRGKFHLTELQDGAVLDLSALEGPWSNTCVLGANTMSVTFVNGAKVDVDIGMRTFVVGDTVVAWPSKPDASVIFTAPASIVAAEQQFSPMNDGLRVTSTAVPDYATYDLEDERLRFFKNDGTELTELWEGGVTANMQARFGSLAELNALKALGVTPYGYLMTAFDIPVGTGTVDLGNGVNGVAVDVLSGIILDVQGNVLVLPNANLAGNTSFNVTDSVGGGELRVTVPAGEVLTNSHVVLSGQLKLVKLGAGEYVANLGGQTYDGGTEVVAGTLRAMGMGTSGYYGAKGSTLTVRATATFDFNGYALGGSVFPIILDGGTLMSTVDRNQYARGWLQAVTLTKNSFVRGCYFGFRREPSAVSEQTSLETNGHTLTIDVTAGNFYFAACTATGGGNIVGRTGGCFILGAGDTAQCDFGTTGLVMQGASLQVAAVVPVGDYLSSYVGEEGSWGEEQCLKVSGRFLPEGKWTNCELQNGSTLDLSGFGATWTNSCYFTKNKIYGNCSFAKGAQITVQVGDRTLRNAEQLVAWDQKPDAVFKFPSGRRGELVARSDGLYHYLGLVVIIR